MIRAVEKYITNGKDYEVDEKRDGFSGLELNELYGSLLEKLKTVYCGRPANQALNLEKFKSMFSNSLELSTKAAIINEIINMMRCDISTTANLKEIGGSPNAGNIAISKNMKGNYKLVNQSITGLFVNTEEL